MHACHVEDNHKMMDTPPFGTSFWKLVCGKPPGGSAFPYLPKRIDRIKITKGGTFLFQVPEGLWLRSLSSICLNILHCLLLVLKGMHPYLELFVFSFLWTDMEAFDFYCFY